MPKRVFILEDEEPRQQWFLARYAAVDKVTLAHNVPTALDILKAQSDYDLIFLDHDLNTEPAVGRDVARWLAEHPTEQTSAVMIVHSMNAVSGPKICADLLRAGREAYLIPYALLTQL